MVAVAENTCSRVDAIRARDGRVVALLERRYRHKSARTMLRMCYTELRLDAVGEQGFEREWAGRTT